MQRKYTEEEQKTIEHMLQVIKQLQDLRKKPKSLTNTGKILTNINQFRTTYDKLDKENKERFNVYLQQFKLEFLTAIQKKKGSQIGQVDPLVGLIDDEILDKLFEILIITANTQSNTGSSHTTILKKLSDDGLRETGTFKIHPETQTDQPSLSRSSHNQIALALASQNLKRLSSSYLTQASYGSIRTVRKEDSLTVIIESFETLQKTKENLIKFNNDLPTGFTESYNNTLLKEVNTLRLKMHLSTLVELSGTLINYPQIKEIVSLLSGITAENVNANSLLAIGEKISKDIYINNELIAALQKVKIDKQENKSCVVSSNRPC